jgi:hypothetical protein
VIVAGRSGSFLKKRTKKPLQILARYILLARSQSNQKFFASFFQKRRPYFPWSSPKPARTAEA